MGGARATFRVERDGLPPLETSIDINYPSTDANLGADAHMTPPELELTRRAITGFLAAGQRVVGEVNITEYSGDPHTSMTGTRALATLPAAVLMGTAPVPGGNPVPGAPAAGGPVGPGTPGFDLIRDVQPPQAFYQGELWEQAPNGSWAPKSPRPARPGVAAAPNPNPNPNPPADRPTASEPGRRASGGSPRGRGSPSPPGGGGSIGTNDL